MLARAVVPIAASILAITSRPAFTEAADSVMNRYDLGQRLIKLEKAWDAQTDLEARKRAVPILKLAIPQLFANRNADAAATLDRTRALLKSAEEPSPEARWAESLIVLPASRLVDSSIGSIHLTLLAGYPAGELPASMTAHFAIVGRDSAYSMPAQELPIKQLPMLVTLPVAKLAEGDYVLRTDIVAAGKVLATYDVGFSVVNDLVKRLNRLKVPQGDGKPSIDARTLDSLTSLLQSLARGAVPETNYPAARLIAEAEALSKSISADERFFGAKRAGQFWLTVPTAHGDVPVRVFVPDESKAGKPIPLVVALHGAGGSENLFFDGYGYGKVVRLAKERGWMVVAPRAGTLFDGPPPVVAVIDALAKIYPIDISKVFAVGHSMGAGHAIGAAQQSAERFAAIAPLAGGGLVTKPEAFKNLPTFIGCGSEDFLLSSARAFQRALEKAGAAKMTYKEYPGIEHIVVVQEALPEVFRFFDAAIADRASKKR